MATSGLPSPSLSGPATNWALCSHNLTAYRISIFFFLGGGGGERGGLLIF